MKTILILILCLFATAGLGQASKNLVFKIDHQYIFADTNGNIVFGKRFDYIHNMDPSVGEYIVNSKNKYGVVRNNQVVFPFEYDGVMGLEPNFNFHLYVLERNYLKAVGTADGVTHTGFDYKSIEHYSLDYSSGNEEINNDGMFLELFTPEGKKQLMYLSKTNKSSLLNKEPVDEIKDRRGMFVLKKANQQALFEFDKATATLKLIHPYAEQYFDLNYSSYSIWSPKKGITKRYSYDHILFETLSGREVYDELMISPGIETNEGADDIVRELLIPDLNRARLSLKAGYYSDVFEAFKPKGLSYSLRGDILKFKAQFTISGKKGDWLLDARLPKVWAHEKQKDTTFHVFADEVFILNEAGTSIILTKKGKLFGAMDSRGKEIFAPQFKSLECLRSEEEEDYLLEKTGDAATLYCYDQEARKVYSVLQGKSNDEWEVHSDYILVKRRIGKNKYQSKFVKWIQPFSGHDPIVFDGNVFYDSITPCKSFSYFFNTSQNGKKGVLSSMGQVVIACQYDSIQLNAYFFPLFSQYKNKPDYHILQPVFSAYLDGKQHIFHPTNSQTSGKLIHSFEDGSLDASAKISNDGLFVTNELENNSVMIYSINGKLFSREPLILHTDNKQYASFTHGYWYVRGKDSHNKDILIGQNGAWFVLPDK